MVSLMIPLLCWTLCISSVSAEVDQINITAEPGQNITLPCRLPGNKPAAAVDWIRTDLGSGYVLLYRDGRIDPGNQNPSYQNRVDLMDRQMKDGDVYLVLKNLTTNDTGLYQCRVQKEGSLDIKLIRTINLQVLPPANQINITAEPGQSITLPCRLPGNKPAAAVDWWIRTDLGSGYVLLYRDGRIDPGNQNPSYQNRVDLMDRQMKDGDVSLVLKNLMTNDTGLYQCRVQYEGSLDAELIRTINLQVLPPGESLTLDQNQQLP
uniref:Ig-like domain-containing protein n=1 Tax=Poecilia formosa TaxID=48698 RepID=A0A087X6I8_POEFO